MLHKVLICDIFFNVSILIFLQSPTESEHESDDELDFDDARSHSPSPSAQSTGSLESGGVRLVVSSINVMKRSNH